jgi:hypothetical protein
MKRIALFSFLAAISLAPIFAQVRMDFGFDIPRGLGAIADGGMEDFREAGEFLDQFILPFPEAGLYYQWSAGPVNFGAGVRVFTLILESIYWPNAYVELELERFAFQFQLGGGLFGMFGVFSHIETGAVAIPDLSAWFKIGRSFRIGGGGIGLMLPEVSNNMIFAYYLGAKFAILF